MRRTTIGIVAVALVAAACSSGGDDAAPTTTAGAPTGESTTTTAAPAAPHYGGHVSEIYGDPASWICRPDLDDDPCDSDMDATVVAADGTLTPAPLEVDPDAPVDCFYVYPTISGDATPNSDLVPGGEEINVVRNQVAPLAGQCRVYAPVYRQVTLGALFGAINGEGDGAEPDRELAYGDVLDAFQHFIDNDSQGRPFVLVGHSQGAGVLNRLIAEEIDGDDELRDRLVSALLLGMGVAVPPGEDVGGDFQQVPACRAPDQVGCVVSFASFRATATPPATSFFGRPRGGDGDEVVLCTNPAALAGGSAELADRFPLTGGSGFADPARNAEIDTAFVIRPGLLSAECVERDGFTYLEVTVHGDPADPRVDDIPGDLTPEWGLHLVDANLVMGDLQQLVASQTAAWLAAHA